MHLSPCTMHLSLSLLSTAQWKVGIYQNHERKFSRGFGPFAAVYLRNK